jgi:predicted metal-dependent phosphoesterase TrpH
LIFGFKYKYTQIKMNNQSDFKIDLHTHSILSKDGGITKEQYVSLLEKGVLDAVAITDHNETGFARALQKELGERIIVGEEITTGEGEIIGLFLSERIEPGLSVIETVARIKAQNGLVYIPHPFETLRSGLQEEVLNTIIEDIDVVEIFNARGRWRGKSGKATEFAHGNSLAGASASDAHCRLGLGSAFSTVSELPEAKNLVKILKSGKNEKKYASVASYICPGLNRVKNKLFLGAKR